MPDDVHIRGMRLEDLPFVQEIEEKSFSTPWSLQAFVSEVKDNVFADYVVAVQGTRVVGYAGMWAILDEAHITNIAVDPELRGKHIGELLLLALQERARVKGCTRMTLEVRVSNEVAQKLYEKHDFVVRGIRPRYYTDNQEDALIMWKDWL